jgi:hypothetical protein
MNARITPQMTQRCIKDMKVGDEYWTVPWAMYADLDGELWLNSNYSFHSEPGGTVEMKVIRMGHGFMVDISKCDRRWNEGEPNYSNEFVPEPVVEVINKEG